MKSKKALYWISTALMCGLFLFSAMMYFTQYEMVQGFFEHLGFPIWIIYPLATLKVLAVLAILTNQIKILSEWAYAGFFFDAVLATAAHHFAGDGFTPMSIAGIVLVIMSRVMWSAR